MQRYTVYLETALHVHLSGGTYAHQQERKQLYLQHLVFVTPLLCTGRSLTESDDIRCCINTI